MARREYAYEAIVPKLTWYDLPAGKILQRREGRSRARLRVRELDETEDAPVWIVVGVLIQLGETSAASARVELPAIWECEDPVDVCPVAVGIIGVGLLAGLGSVCPPISGRVELPAIWECEEPPVVLPQGVLWLGGFRLGRGDIAATIRPSVELVPTGDRQE